MISRSMPVSKLYLQDRMSNFLVFSQKRSFLRKTSQHPVPPPKIPHPVLKTSSHNQILKTFNNMSFDKIRGITLRLNDNNADWVCQG